MTPARLRTLIFVLIFIGGMIVGFFGPRALRGFREFGGHRPPLPPSAADAGREQFETDVNLIRDWMTIPFISRMYRLPEKVLFDSLGIPANKNKEKSLKRLNQEYFPQEDGVVLEKIKAAALANQPQQTEENPQSPVVPVPPTLAP